jgi:murein L,D-transpeptidase YafK
MPARACPHAHSALALVLLLSLSLAAACARAPSPAPAPGAAIPAPAETPGQAGCELIVRIEVHKADRSLRAHCASGAVVEMRAALGREPLGPKRAAGDMRTPEGLYRIVGPIRESRFHRFVPLDYPSRADADAALIAGELSLREYARILEAHAAGELPPGDTALGGEIGLHGEGEHWQGYTGEIDWTHGCVAVTDAEIDFIAERVEEGTPVEILP